MFGSLLTLDGLFGDGWAAVALVALTLLRRAAGGDLDRAGRHARRHRDRRRFMAWFGPKGVATMTFSLLVLGEGVPSGERIFNLAALCVFASILAHGLTDTPGVRVAGIRREARPAPERPGTPTRPAGGAPA